MLENRRAAAGVSNAGGIGGGVKKRGSEGGVMDGVESWCRKMMRQVVSEIGIGERRAEKCRKLALAGGVKSRGSAGGALHGSRI